MKPVIAESANKDLERSPNSNTTQLLKSDSINDSNFQQKSQDKLTISAKELFRDDEKTEKYVDTSLMVQGVTRVTGVELNQTEKGLQVILETAGGQLVPLIFPEGNNLVIDLLDATLNLPTGNEYRETDPSPGINEIALTPVNASSIRLTITGETQVPDAEIVPSNQN